MINTFTTDTYDYIFSGTGCAGYSLLLRMLQEPTLQHKKILLIDADLKQQNDRTWCFWETQTGFFEPIVHHAWSTLQFYANEQPKILAIAPYQYKMIRAIDFYQYAQQQIASYHNITILNKHVLSVGNEKNRAFATTDSGTYYATFVFNSIVFKNNTAIDTTNGATYRLLQHFKGWEIETAQPVFEPTVATFMDFRVPQLQQTTFVYVLPTSSTKALVEYTFFNQQLLQQHEYNILLKNYLSQQLQLTNYTITASEYGVIPMTNQRFASHNGNVIHIGTAGGWTKGSSGFTFQFIQKNTQQMVQMLAQKQIPIVTTSLLQQRFHWYDATLLHILHHQKMSGKSIFTAILTKQPPQKLLRFLDNETNLLQELQIMATVPTRIFLPAALHEFWNRCMDK